MLPRPERAPSPVRPEKIRIAEQLGAGAVNSCAGVVDDIVYLGSTTHHRVRTPGGDVITVLRQNDTAESIFPVGWRVHLWWEPDATHLLDD